MEKLLKNVCYVTRLVLCFALLEGWIFPLFCSYMEYHFPNRSYVSLQQRWDMAVFTNRILDF